MDRPKVSVIVPVYNVERYLDKCLSCLVEQTLKDIEIILVNDGSSDGSKAILDDYEARFSDRIRVVHRENGGQATARNLAIAMSTGEYLAFVDSDDYIELDMIEKMYQKAKEADADIVQCGFRYVYDDGAVKERGIDPELQDGGNIHDDPKMLARASAFVWNKIFRRELFTETGIRFPDQKMEDVAIAYALLANAKKIAFVDEPLYNYRASRPGSTSNTLNRSTYDIFKACDSIISFFKEEGLYEKFKDEIEYRVITHVTLRFNLLLGITDAAARDEYVDAAFDYLDKNIPDWRINPYYMADRQAKVDEGRDNEYHYARIDREKLKKFYKKRALKKKVKSIGGSLKKLKKSSK